MQLGSYQLHARNCLCSSITNFCVEKLGGLLFFLCQEHLACKDHFVFTACMFCGFRFDPFCSRKEAVTLKEPALGMM